MKKLIAWLQKFITVIFIEQTRSSQAEMEMQYKNLLKELIKVMPESLLQHGYSVYSQNEEDGIIRYIFNKIGVNEILFLEFGVHRSENNSLNAIMNGGRGVWVDKGLSKLKNELGHNNILYISDEFVSLENIYSLYQNALTFLKINNQDLDLISLDLDGNDFYFIQELLRKGARPKLFCLEYNPRFYPPSKVKIKYDSKHTWQNDDYYGCSLQEYVDLLGEFDYTLIVCNITGSNCLFVRNEFADYFKIYSVNELYQPARPFYSPRQRGNVSLKYLQNLILEKNISDSKVENLKKAISH